MEEIVKSKSLSPEQTVDVPEQTVAEEPKKKREKKPLPPEKVYGTREWIIARHIYLRKIKLKGPEAWDAHKRKMKQEKLERKRRRIHEQYVRYRRNHPDPEDVELEKIVATVKARSKCRMKDGVKFIRQGCRMLEIREGDFSVVATMYTRYGRNPNKLGSYGLMFTIEFQKDDDGCSEYEIRFRYNMMQGCQVLDRTGWKPETDYTWATER